MRMRMLAALTAAAFVGIASTASADVTLMRGSFAETVPAGGASALPAVLRGARALPAPAVAPSVPVTEAAASRRAVVAGRVLWLVDEASGRLQACWLRGTGYAGENGVVCTAP